MAEQDWDTLLRLLLKRHAPVKDDNWGAHYCATCWDKHGSRPVWPCPEALAIMDLIPGGVPSTSD